MRSRETLSIRRKLLLWLWIPLICLCTLSGFIAFRLAEKFADESYDRLLMRSADSIAARLKRNEDGVVVVDLPVAAQAILRYGDRDEFYYQIADSFGHRLTGDAVLPLPQHPEEKGPKFRYATINGQKVRICRLSVQINPSTDEIWVQVAETLNSRHQLVEQIFISIVAPQLALVALASLSVWLGVTFGLAPLDKLGRLLKSRRTVDLSPVDIGAAPAELTPVLNSLNALLLKASNHIESQRQFIGNAAHQMRTPVTALRTYVDHAERIKEDDHESLSPVLNQMSEATRRVSHLLNRLLSLARSEEHVPKGLERVDLSHAVRDAAGNVIHEALTRGVELDFDMPERPVLIEADKGELLEMLTNLLENAICYTGANGSVWVKILPGEGKKIVLLVEDNGPGIKEAEKTKVFERFYRVPGTNGSGCGLGLSIVAEIAKSNNVEIEILDRTGGGTVFQLTFVECPVSPVLGGIGNALD